MSKKRAISLLLLLAIAALLISGCAPQVDAEGNVSAPTWIAILSVPLQKLIEFVYYQILTPIGLPSFGDTEQEVDVSQRAPILKAYLQHAPGARPHMAISKDAPISEFENVASKYPVFRLERIV